MSFNVDIEGRIGKRGTLMASPAMIDLGTTELVAERIGALPILNAFWDRLGLTGLLERWVPARDARVRLAPATVLKVAVANLALGHRPVYALGEWAAGYDPTLLGLADAEQFGLLNDDRVGRTLAGLFDADRASLLTELSVGMIAAFDLDVSQLHNDSTTLTVHGDYAAADGRRRGGKPTARVAHGHNKDHRPDLKQLVVILTVSADGAVPLAHRVVDGNTSDDPTHIPTWEALVALTGRTDFLYVADCKLASAQALDHIHSRGGRFVTVLPRGRKEDLWFRDWIADHSPEWAEALRLPGARADDVDHIWRSFEPPAGSAQGHRIIWYHNNHKAIRDATADRSSCRSGGRARRVGGRFSTAVHRGHPGATGPRAR
jgi:hypothetical protein